MLFVVRIEKATRFVKHLANTGLGCVTRQQPTISSSSTLKQGLFFRSTASDIFL